MYRLTTPLQTFKFNTNTSTFTKIVATYQQKGKNVIEKKKSDMTFTTETEGGVTYYLASFSLTQADTKKLSANDPCYVQVRVLTTTNQSWASQIFEVDVREVLNNEVL